MVQKDTIFVSKELFWDYISQNVLLSLEEKYEAVGGFFIFTKEFRKNPGFIELTGYFTIHFDGSCFCL